MFRSNLIGLFCVLFSTGLLAENLDLSAGAMTLGGSALVKYSNQEDNWRVAVAANGGYFMMKDLALVLDIQASGKLSSGFDQQRLYQMAVGVFYALDLDSNLYPYGQILGHTAYSESGWSVGFTPAMGLLVGLTSQIALDFGVSTRVDFAISRAGGTHVDVGMGYVGVRAFF